MSIEKLPIIKEIKSSQQHNPETLQAIGFGLVIGGVLLSKFAPVVGALSAITGLAMVEIGTRKLRNK
ncbi:hypothetical protein HYT02_03800 [Candidatus Gottesmanbacteria bacterium]|nr:hypothetical protein [Candidatus Gottesmanbacteria bacterium]